MKKILLLFCFTCTCQLLWAQAAVSYYPITSYIGVSTNPTRKLWADLRLQTNTFAGYSNLEFSPKINLKRNEFTRIYAGLGVNFNIAYGAYNGQYINGYIMCAGITVSPFKQVRNLSFIFEIAPYANAGFTGGMIRTTPGISWQFLKRKQLPQ